MKQVEDAKILMDIDHEDNINSLLLSFRKKFKSLQLQIFAMKRHSKHSKNKFKQFLSLLIVILLMSAATITVKKSIFGYDLQQSQDNVSAEQRIDPITFSSNESLIINTSSLEIEGSPTGYAGPVPVEIHIDNGIITDIEPLPNAETPNFFKRAETLIESWLGKTPEDGLKIRPDAVSGATYSSNALISNVESGLAYYEGVKADTPASMSWKIWIALAVTLAACILPLFIRNKIYHNIQIVANILVLGFWCGQFLDYARIMQYLAYGITLPIGLVAIAMLIAAFIYPLFGHPQHYCNHICPLGSAQQLMAQICGYKIHMSRKLLNILDWVRKIIWVILMIFLFIGTLSTWTDYELFQVFQFESASWWIIGTAILFIALSSVVTRPYCRFVCPTGSLFKRAENIG